MADQAFFLADFFLAVFFAAFFFGAAALALVDLADFLPLPNALSQPWAYFSLEPIRMIDTVFLHQFV